MVNPLCHRELSAMFIIFICTSNSMCSWLCLMACHFVVKSTGLSSGSQLKDWATSDIHYIYSLWSSISWETDLGALTMGPHTLKKTSAWSLRARCAKYSMEFILFGPDVNRQPGTVVEGFELQLPDTQSTEQAMKSRRKPARQEIDSSRPSLWSVGKANGQGKDRLSVWHHCINQEGGGCEC